MDENEAQASILEICTALEESDSEGLMTVSREGRIRQIEARSSRNPEFSRKVWNKPWLCMEAEFICPRPYFVDMSLQTMSAEFYEELTDIAEQGIEFTTEGREFSMIMIIGSRLMLMQNDGNAEAPVKIKFEGPTVNPYIKNKTSGEIIRITRTLWENEYIKIDTTPGKREIKLFKNETLENGMHYLDLESKFWKMLTGENMIEIGEGSPGAGAKYFMEFYTHYKEA